MLTPMLTGAATATSHAAHQAGLVAHHLLPGILGHRSVPTLSSALQSKLQATGWLESIWTGVVPAVLLGVVVLLTVRRFRRHRGWTLLLAGTAGALALTLVSGAGFANWYAGYLPDFTAASRLLGYSTVTLSASTTDRTGLASGTGQVTKFTVADPASAIPPSPLWVYTPPGYDAPGNTARYPVVYLLHGYAGNSSDWFSAGRADVAMNLLIANHDLPPAIVVAPDMNAGTLPRDTEGMNLPGGPQVETYLTQTVVNWADSHLRTIADPAHRIIGGASAGGSVALDLGLRHQDVYGGILSEEPYGDPGTSTLPELQGNQTLFTRYSPDRYIPTLRFTRAIPTYIDVGGNASIGAAKSLAQMLATRGQPVSFHIEPGVGHTWHEARIGLPYGLVWLAAQLGWATTTA